MTEVQKQADSKVDPEQPKVEKQPPPQEEDEDDEESPKAAAVSHRQLSTVVQGTAENLLGRLEEVVGSAGCGTPDGVGGEDDLDDDEVLQDSEPGPLSQDPKDVEEVLNIISQSIYREGQGRAYTVKRDKPFA